MKRLVFRIAAVAALVGTPALGADMQLKAVTCCATTPVYSWTGFYIGAQGGGAWGQSDEASPIPNTAAFQGTQNYNISGGFGGAVIGVNYQINSIVVGLEGDFNWSKINGTSSVINIGPPNLGDTFMTNVRSYDEAKVRIGYAWNQALFYVDGGGVWGGVFHEYNANLNGGAGNSFVTTKAESGWTVGAGLEYAFARNWSGRVEYDWDHLGPVAIQYSPAPLDRSTWTEGWSSLKVGVNWRFDWGSPAPACCATK
jgi:outer membrane immunogenic protein